MSAKPIIGMIAGNGTFPLRFVESAKREGYDVVAVAHKGETDPAIEKAVKQVVWIKVGELGKIISTFIDARVHEAVMAGGINRVNFFGGVKLDARGMALISRIRSTKDDAIMRGVAEELEREGVKMISCVRFMQEWLVKEGVLTVSGPTAEETEDIQVGKAAIAAMNEQHIGQTVVVREGVITAVEAVEGTDAAILRGGELGGKGAVVVKFAKPSQDIRFDVPTIGLRTIKILDKVGARVLALEAGRTLMIEPEEVIALANRKGISIVGCKALI